MQFEVDRSGFLETKKNASLASQAAAQREILTSFFDGRWLVWTTCINSPARSVSSACFDDTTKADKSQEVENTVSFSMIFLLGYHHAEGKWEQAKKRSFLPSTSGLDVYGDDGQHAQQPAAQ